MEIKDLMPWNWPRPEFAAGAGGTEPLRALQADINRAFESFWQTVPTRFRVGWDMSATSAQGDAGPRVDVVDTNGVIEITVELPGVEEGDIEIDLCEDAVIVRGEKKPPAEGQGRDVLINERTYGVFRRVIPITSTGDQDKVEASFKNGVLTISIPKTEPAPKPAKRIIVAKKG